MKLKIFIMGMIEFRYNSTTSFPKEFMEIYDSGRELMHKITFRKFEPN